MLFEILSSIFDTKHALHLWLCSSQSIVFLRAWIPDLFCQLLISARRPEKGFCSLWTLNVFIKLLAVCGRIKGQFFLTLLCQMCPFNAGVLLFSKNHSEKWFFFSPCVSLNSYGRECGIKAELWGSEWFHWSPQRPQHFQSLVTKQNRTNLYPVYVCAWGPISAASLTDDFQTCDSFMWNVVHTWKQATFPHRQKAPIAMEPSPAARCSYSEHVAGLINTWGQPTRQHSGLITNN